VSPKAFVRADLTSGSWHGEDDDAVDDDDIIA
jgi:hypothetical protein